jgi:PRTRC genetic system protein A
MMMIVESVLSQLVAGSATMLDSAMLTACPVAVVPGQPDDFVALASPGRRVLLAQDGVYLEARSGVLSCRVRLAACDLPFGATTQSVALVGGRPIERRVFDQLADMALRAHPNEMAAIITRDESGQDHIIVPRQTGSVGAVTYCDAEVDELQLVIDAHSHGPFKAAFSSTDDASDRSRIGPHVSLLFGTCESTASLRVSARLCVGSHLIDLDHAVLSSLFEMTPTRAIA